MSFSWVLVCLGASEVHNQIKIKAASILCVMEWSELNRVQELVFKLLFTKEIASKMAFILKNSSLVRARLIIFLTFRFSEYKKNTTLMSKALFQRV